MKDPFQSPAGVAMTDFTLGNHRADEADIKEDAAGADFRTDLPTDI
jgi:hypothetical protein